MKARKSLVAWEGFWLASRVTMDRQPGPSSATPSQQAGLKARSMLAQGPVRVALKPATHSSALTSLKPQPPNTASLRGRAGAARQGGE